VIPLDIYPPKKSVFLKHKNEKLASPRRLIFAGVVCLVFGTASARAQLTNTSVSLPAVKAGSVAWGDYDNDGRLDIALAGYSSPNRIAQIWHNNGDGTFSDINAGLPGFYNCSLAWGDYDNDGRLDLLIAGDFEVFNYVTQLWRNNGNGAFSIINSGLPAITSGSVAWGDYDNDGRVDILLCGATDTGPLTEIWRNNGDGTFSNINAGLPGIDSTAAWGDYDNDGRLDVLIAGFDGSTALAQIWRNTGNGTFTNINAGLPNLGNGAAWGDYNNDGRLDIILSGLVPNQYLASQVWRNNGNGTFTDINAGLQGILGSVAWGDYDNDGWLDILISGDTALSEASKVYRNNGNGTFTDINALPGVGGSIVAWGDYNNDGKFDILLCGNAGTASGRAQVWKNFSTNSNPPPNANTLPNTAPTVPSGLAVAIAGPSIVLSWNSSSDIQTPAPGLTYNLRVGTTPGASDIYSPMSAANGFRRVPRAGNTERKLSLNLPHILITTNYFWSVQAVDNANSGSAFAPEQSFNAFIVLSPSGATNFTPGDLDHDGAVNESELGAVLAHLGTNGVGQANMDQLLLNYFTGNPLYMTEVAGLGSSDVTFSLLNSPAVNFTVQSSTNLFNWQNLGPVSLKYHFTDTNTPPGSNRFYRLSYP
jgi:hypothetical protein